MSYKIVTENCEPLCNGCVDFCPVACIKVNTETDVNGKNQYWIESIDCIECGICLNICPAVGAIVLKGRN